MKEQIRLSSYPEKLVWHMESLFSATAWGANWTSESVVFLEKPGSFHHLTKYLHRLLVFFLNYWVGMIVQDRCKSRSSRARFSTKNLFWNTFQNPEKTPVMAHFLSKIAGLVFLIKEAVTGVLLWILQNFSYVQNYI